jgi:nucleoside-diphosphate-sugar epimerase
MIMRSIFVTGATGLVGLAVIRRLLTTRPHLHVHALVRTTGGAALVRARLGDAAARVTFVTGDITLPGLGLDRTARAFLGRSVDTIIHAAADTTFSRDLGDARRVNVAGTRHMLELAAAWDVDRFVHLSTAYVAGTRTGVIGEASRCDGRTGGAAAARAVPAFVNAYEQSKHEAEAAVRQAGTPFVILRPSTIVCDDPSGAFTQLNAVHRALRVFHAGLAALMPGDDATPVDLITTDHVVAGVIAATFSEAALGASLHLCAGVGAIPLGELLDRAHAAWSTDPDWRRRCIARPALTDLATYRLFERSIAETGDVRLTTISRSLSHFVPQLALPKQFETAAADALIGRSAPPVATWWDALLRELLVTRWGAIRRAA